jgi:hypothetical protein
VLRIWIARDENLFRGWTIVCGLPLSGLRPSGWQHTLYQKKGKQGMNHLFSHSRRLAAILKKRPCLCDTFVGVTISPGCESPKSYHQRAEHNKPLVEGVPRQLAMSVTSGSFCSR